MEVDGIEINFPEQIKNVVLNEFYVSLEANEVKRMILRETFKIYNKNGVSTDKVLKIFKEVAEATAEIENLYGGGVNDE